VQKDYTCDYNWGGGANVLHGLPNFPIIYLFFVMALGLPMEGLQYFFEVNKQKNNRKKQVEDKFIKGEKK
jgi:hypothetical protein